MVVEIELLINGSKDEVINKLLEHGFNKMHACRTIANYYLPPGCKIDDINKTKEYCVRLRKSIVDNYMEGFALGNSKLLKSFDFCNFDANDGEIKISTDEDSLNLEKSMIDAGFRLIYTDDKDDIILEFNNKEIVFQIQDLKNIGLIVAYDNSNYYELSYEEQRNKLITDVLNFGIEPQTFDNVNRFSLLLEENYFPIDLSNIIEIFKNGDDKMKLTEIIDDNFDDQTINDIVYTNIDDDGLSSKYGLVFGNNMLINERVQKAVELYNEKRIKKLIFMGGVNGVSNQNESLVAEADKMKELAMKLGVLEEDILVDNTSNNTFENVDNALNILGDEITLISNLIIVTSEFHLKRCYAILKKKCPNIGVTMVAAKDGFTDSDNWFLSDNSWNTGRSIATYEAHLLVRYSKEDKIADLDIKFNTSVK